MALDSAALVNALTSHAAASGYFERVNGHEPANAPGNGMTCAVWIQRIAPTSRISGLSVTGALVVLNVRVYINATVDPADWVDPAVGNAVDALIAAYSGHFTLGGQVMCVDLRGIAGTPLDAVAGWLDIGQASYRVMTITVPLLVDAVWTEAP